MCAPARIGNSRCCCICGDSPGGSARDCARSIVSCRRSCIRKRCWDSPSLSGGLAALAYRWTRQNALAWTAALALAAGIALTFVFAARQCSSVRRLGPRRIRGVRRRRRADPARTAQRTDAGVAHRASGLDLDLDVRDRACAVSLRARRGACRRMGRCRHAVCRCSPHGC